MRRHSHLAMEQGPSFAILLNLGVDGGPPGRACHLPGRHLSA